MLEAALSTLLRSHATVKIATADGAPWVAAAFFAEEDLFVLRVMLEARGRTLANIRANPSVALMIEDGDAFSLFAQADGRAQMIDGDAAPVQRAIAAKTPASATLVTLPDLVPVSIEVERWRLTDVSAGWLPARELRRA